MAPPRRRFRQIGSPSGPPHPAPGVIPARRLQHMLGSRLSYFMRHTAAHPDARLNLLLSYGGWREHAAVRQLPQLLEPMGIHAMEADTGEEAASLIQHQPIHIAVVDLEIPLSGTGPRPTPGGPRILQLLRRLDQPPPTIVVRPRQASNRQDVRELMASLREGAFAVIDRPLQLETILDTLRRVLRRHYQDAWPPMR